MWPNPQLHLPKATYTEEILNGKLHFSCKVSRENNSTITNRHSSFFSSEENSFCYSLSIGSCTVHENVKKLLTTI